MAILNMLFLTWEKFYNREESMFLQKQIKIIVSTIILASINISGAFASVYDCSSTGGGEIINITDEQEHDFLEHSRNESTRYFTFSTPVEGDLHFVFNSSTIASYKLSIGTQGCESDNIYPQTATPREDTTISIQPSTQYFVKIEAYVYPFATTTMDFSGYFEFTSTAPTQQNTPPLINVISDKNEVKGEPIDIDLSQYVVKTDGDDILKYYLSGCQISGLLFNEDTGVISGTADTIGEFACGLSAEDKDGASKEESFLLKIDEFETINDAKDLCYDEPIEGGMCINIGMCQGGIGCSIKYPLRNIGNEEISDVTVIYDEDHIGGHVFGNCKIEQSGDCHQESDYEFGPVGIMDNVNVFEFDQPFQPKVSGNNIYTEALVSGTCLNSDSLYGEYMKDGKRYRGKLNPCSERYKCANPKKFDIQYQTNQKGSMLLIGNTNICKDDGNGVCTDSGTSNNNNIDAIWKDGDLNNDTNSSSSAKLIIPDGAEVLWAGLYWQGYFVETDMDKLLQKQESAEQIKLGFSDIKGSKTITYQNIVADRLNHVYFSASRWYYQGFKEITDFVKANKEGWYWGADISTTLGKPRGGTLGAWSIAVVYADENETIKNLTVFDGYLALANDTDTKNAKDYAIANQCDEDNTGVQNTEVSMELTGFLTPKFGRPDSRLIFFGGEGDIGLRGDYLSLQDKYGVDHKISNSANPEDNVMNSSITDNGIHRGSDLLYPRYGTNTIGIDIDTYDVSDIIGNEQKKTVAKMDTDGEGYFPGIFGFYTEFKVPEICYDYTMFINNYKIESKDNKIKTQMGEYDTKIDKRIFIRSKDGNFNITDSNLSYKINNTNIVKYERGSLEIAENGKYNYEAVDSSKIISENDTGFKMRIGEGDSSDINPLESRYIAFEDKIEDHENDTEFSLQLDAKVDYGLPGVPEIPFTKIFTQDDICGDDNGSYNVDYTIFNVTEQVFNDHDTYNLFTKISGQEMKYNVYAYEGTDNTQLLNNIELHMPVEIEMIKANDFDRNGTVSCGDKYARIDEAIAPHKIVYIEKNKGELVFNSGELNLAYPSLSFRIHYFLDANNTIITDHNCSRANTQACREMYNDNLSVLPECELDCTSSNSQRCYECLFDNYDRFSCARDNFTIRPRAFRVSILDSNQSNTGSFIKVGTNNIDTSSSSNRVNITAGYSYRVDINATGMTHPNNAVKMYIQPFGDMKNKGVFLKWDPTTMVNCADTEDQNISLVMFNGTSKIGNKSQMFKNTQIGEYSLRVYDKNISRYDWHGYYTGHHQKAHFIGDRPDCIEDRNDDVADNSGRVGCITNTSLPLSGYFDLKQEAYPYRFDISGITKGGGPQLDKNFVYYNTLSNDPYPFGFGDTGELGMSYNIKGKIKAVDYDGSTVKNFTAECFAKDVDISVNYQYLSGVPNGEYNSNLIYTLTNIDDKGQEYRTVNTQSILNRILPLPASKDDKIMAIHIQQKADFLQAMEGELETRIGYNFERKISHPTDPRLMNFSAFTVQLKNQPVKLYANMSDSYKVRASDDAMDTNITFIYGYAKPNLFLYDQITENTVNTPIMIVAYCNMTEQECRERGLEEITSGMLTDVATKSNNLYIVEKHDPFAGYGDVYLSTDPLVATVTSNPQFFQGYAENIVVTDAGTQRPNTANIQISNNTARWLIYNEAQENTPTPFYKVRFIGKSGWSGSGKTGHIVGGHINPKRSRRLE